jgi:hypothetical protein
MYRQPDPFLIVAHNSVFTHYPCRVTKNAASLLPYRGLKERNSA